jgi:hypothetical protein
MIERHTIDGRDATVAYFDDQFQPVADLSKPHNTKILFDDGEVVFLSSPPPPPQPLDATRDSGQHDGEGFDKHRAKHAPKKLHIYGKSLGHWARDISGQELTRIRAAIDLGLSAGDDNTGIAHRVIGSRKHNGINGATEITRQHILNLGRGYLRKRKNRMGGASSDVR